MNSLISVIVPVYNVENYLPYCLDSILQQTYEELEVILIDDGSTDRSGMICDEYAQRDKRIKLFHKNNEGVSAARNNGLDHINGKYVTFVDSDDIIHPQLIEVLLDTLNKYDGDISCTCYSRIDIYPETYSYINLDNFNDVSSFSGIEVLQQIYDEDSALLLSVVWGKLYRREIIEGIRFPYGMVHEDEFFTYKIFFKASKVCFANIKLYFYLIRPGSITNDVSTETIQNKIMALKDRMEFLKSKQMDILEVKTIFSLFNNFILLYSFERTAEGKEKAKKEFNKFYFSHKFFLKQFELIHRIRLRLFYLSPNIYFGLYKFKKRD